MLHVSLIGINQDLDLIVDAVFEDILYVVIIVFRQLHGGNTHFTCFPIPMGNEIIRFILPPVVKIVVVLNAIFPKSFLQGLSLEDGG